MRKGGRWRVEGGGWRIEGRKAVVFAFYSPPSTLHPPLSPHHQRVAQFGSARASGARGRRFESFHADCFVSRRSHNGSAAGRNPADSLSHWGFKSLPAHDSSSARSRRALLARIRVHRTRRERTCRATSNPQDVTRRKFQWRNARFQIGRRQVRSLPGVLGGKREWRMEDRE